MITTVKQGAFVAGVLAAVAGVAGCNEAPPPATVIVNTPPSDGGPLVLLTVMVAAAFVLAGVAVVCGWGWASERRTRRDAEDACRDAEDALVALTGQPLRGARLVIDRRAGEQRPTGQSVARRSE